MENYPFFKFHPGEWREGEISFLPLQTQGLFINICCLYWLFSGRLSWQMVSKRLASAKREDDDRLIADKILIENEGFIQVSFLQRQMEKCSEKSQKNAESGREGAKKRSELLAIAKQTLIAGKPNVKRVPSNGSANVKQKEREDKIRKIDSNTTVGSSVTSNEASNGSANSDSPTGLWARLSSKANLSAEEKEKGEKKCLSWLEKIFACPKKQEIIQKLRDDFKLHPHLFADAEEIESMLEITYEDFNPEQP